MKIDIPYPFKGHKFPQIGKNGGQSLVELLLTIGISAILFPALITGFAATRNGRAQAEHRLQALAYFKEAQEAMRVITANDWSALLNGTYHPVESGGTWSLAPGSETIGGSLTRQIVLSDTYRDVNGDIAQSGTRDPSTVKATISVSWGTPLASEISIDSYFSRYVNQNHTDTAISDFSGTVEGATVSATFGSFAGDGQIQLGAGGGGDWCAPSLTLTALDLPKNGVANALAAIEGKAFAGTGENASGISYATVSVSNNDPPSASVSGTFDGHKTNDGIFGDADFAYLATDTNSKEVVIVNLNSISGGKFDEAGYFNAPGNGDGISAYVSGDIGYMVDAAGTLYSFDLSSRFGSRPMLQSRTLAGIGRSIAVSGNYVFVAQTGSTQLQIIESTNGGSTLTVVAQVQLPAGSATDVFVNSTGSRAYVATAVSATQREMFIIDTSVKSGNLPIIGSYETNGMSPKGITVVPGNKAIVVGTGAQEYQVIDITNESSPIACGGLNIDSGVNGVAGVVEEDGDAYAYIITGDASAEFKIIEGGPGGQFATSGTYTSPAFDAGRSVAFNRFTVNHIVPELTEMGYEIAVADAVNNNCSEAVYSYSQSFATSSALPSSTADPNYVNPGRCMRYRVSLSTTEILQSPVLFDITFNYSP